MDFAELKAALKTKIEPVYLLCGTDIFLLYKAIDLITDASGEAEQEKFDGEVSPAAVVSACKTPSFFAPKRVIVYKVNTKFDTDKNLYKIDTKFDMGEINGYTKMPDSSCVLIIMGLADKNIFGIKGATEVNCNPMAAEVLIKLIANQVAPKRITQTAARFLCDAAANNYSSINNELNKIINYFTDVDLLDVGHIKEFVTKTTDYQIYELGSNILQNKLAESQKIIDYLDGTGVAEYAVFGGVLSQFRRAYYSVATRGGQDAVAKVLGCSPYAIVYSRRDFAGKAKEIAARYLRALELEYKIKSGQISVQNAIFSLICRPEPK
jgi:DNA polymerase III delta subunit